MPLTSQRLMVGFLFAGVLLVISAGLQTQQAGRGAGNVVLAADETDAGISGNTQQVRIDCESLRLIDPQTYQVPLQLVPIRTVALAAPVEGIIRSVEIKTGQEVDPQTEVVRLDSTEQELLLKRAKANLRVAQIELRRAKLKADADLIELNEAKLDAATADRELASHRLERTRIRVPFAAKVFRVDAVVGQLVRAGDRLLTIGDTSRFTVEIPVDRKKVLSGSTIELRIEEATVNAQVESILPLDARFEPLRDVVNSIASAIVVIGNRDNRFQAGQTVYAPLVPRYPVTEIPTVCITNAAGGQRKVQVLRKNVVRDVPIRLFGQVGVDRIYVSGPFAQGDEVIVKSSQELPEGTMIRLTSAAGPAKSARTRTSPSSGGRVKSRKKTLGF